MANRDQSSRHSKITGDFAESLVLYWLSSDGFECANIDHTGIDIIANNKYTGERMGISVKSRSRKKGREGTGVSFSEDNFVKAAATCKIFGCVPYFAIVVDEGERITGYITSMKHLKEIRSGDTQNYTWSMTPAWRRQYEGDPRIMRFALERAAFRWWSDSSGDQLLGDPQG